MYQFHYEITHYFDATHHLPGYPGKCSQVHQHRWTVIVEITVRARQLPESGMFVDFLKVKEVIRELDGRDLNDLFKQPTAEYIAMWLIDVLDMFILDAGNYGVRVMVQETTGSKVSVEQWFDLYEVKFGSSEQAPEESGTFKEGDIMVWGAGEVPA